MKLPSMSVGGGHSTQRTCKPHRERTQPAGGSKPASSCCALTKLTHAALHSFCPISLNSSCSLTQSPEVTETQPSSDRALFSNSYSVGFDGWDDSGLGLPLQSKSAVNGRKWLPIRQELRVKPTSCFKRCNLINVICLKKNANQEPKELDQSLAKKLPRASGQAACGGKLVSYQSKLTMTIRSPGTFSSSVVWALWVQWLIMHNKLLA